MNNVYYSPEKFGLTPVAEIGYGGGSYEYDTRVVWRNASGDLVTARDLGCSCPCPFEWVGISDLAAVSVEELKEEVAKNSNYTTPDERTGFIRKVEDAIGAARR